MSTLFEKKWPSVIISPIAVADHIITVSDTKGLHPKQKVTFTATGQPTLEAQVYRVYSKTQFSVIALESKFANPTLLNPIDYNGGMVTAVEDERNAIDANAGIRAAYAEEPTVALRNALVDYYGDYIDSIRDQDGTNRLAVDADFPDGLKPRRYDEIQIDRFEDTKDIQYARFLLAGVLQRELELEYDDDEDLIHVQVIGGADLP